MYNSSGVLEAEYRYDAWGNHEVINHSSMLIGDVNPFRYRSYYFGEETGLYYLNSRYYDPEVGRFINADDVSYLDPESINGLNLYAYCLNNSVMYIDRDGTNPFKFWAQIASSLMIIGGAICMFIPGAAVAIGATGVLAGVSILAFASTNRPGNNRKQNEQIREALRNLGLNPKDNWVKDLINLIENSIRKEGANLGWKELLEYIKDFI